MVLNVIYVVHEFAETVELMCLTLKTIGCALFVLKKCELCIPLRFPVSIFISLSVCLFFSLCVCVCVWCHFVSICLYQCSWYSVEYNCLHYLMRHFGNWMLITGDIFNPNCYWAENLFQLHGIFHIYGESTEKHYQKHCRGQQSLQQLFETAAIHRMCHIVDLSWRIYIYLSNGNRYFCTIAKVFISLKKLHSAFENGLLFLDSHPSDWQCSLFILHQVKNLKKRILCHLNCEEQV